VRGALRRSALLFAGLFLAYALTAGLEAEGSSRFAGDESHVLLAAQSLVEDGDFDVLDDLREGSYHDFQPAPVRAIGKQREGQLLEPTGIGMPLLIAPAFAVAGATGASLLLAAIAALAVCLGYRLALRVVPDPWALGTAAAVGLSPPLLVHAPRCCPRSRPASAWPARPCSPCARTIGSRAARRSCCSPCSASCHGWG